MIGLALYSPNSTSDGSVWILRLRDQNHRGLPERGFLAGRIENRHLAAVFAGRELGQRQTELDGRGLDAIA